MASICEAFANHGYTYAPLVIDAQLFVPQSRPRLFVVAYKQGLADAPADLLSDAPTALWHPDAFNKAYDLLSKEARRSWLWLNLPTPPRRQERLLDIIENAPVGVNWHSTAETHRLLEMMTAVNRAKVDEAVRSGNRMVGAIYKRTRKETDGVRRQRAEIRFDDLAGCLRTLWRFQQADHHAHRGRRHQKPPSPHEKPPDSWDYQKITNSHNATTSPTISQATALSSLSYRGYPNTPSPPRLTC